MVGPENLILNTTVHQKNTNYYNENFNIEDKFVK